MSSAGGRAGRRTRSRAKLGATSEISGWPPHGAHLPDCGERSAAKCMCIVNVGGADIQRALMGHLQTSHHCSDEEQESVAAIECIFITAAHAPKSCFMGLRRVGAEGRVDRSAVKYSCKRPDVQIQALSIIDSVEVIVFRTWPRMSTPLVFAMVV